jgi:hypothetical protein
VIQAAIDYLARVGGGTVRLLPGTFRLRNAVYLRSGIRLVGAGSDTILTKESSACSPLAADTDWFDQEITLQDPTGFSVGDGVCLQARNPHHEGRSIVKRTLVARSGNRFKLDRAPRENFWQLGEATVSTLFPLLSGEEIEDVALENLVLDGNREGNDLLDGNHAGCVFLQDCRRVSIRGVEARNYNGDGLSWQICHDVVVEDCHSHDHSGLGLHPGSGSQRPVMRRNLIERCRIGLFFCWGVRGGTAEDNRIFDATAHGMSIGHHDTENWVANNLVRGSGVAGVLFRPERGPTFAGHRNLLEGNRLIDNGGPDGAAIDIQGGTEATVLLNNHLEETRDPGARVGIRLGAETRDTRLIGNRIDGFAVPVLDLRAAGTTSPG